MDLAHYLRRALPVLGLLASAGMGAAAGPGPADGVKWYKGNTHTHSLWSDGNGFPEMIVDWYRDRGYHFLVLSDHNILSRGEKWVDAKRAGGSAVMDAYLARFGEAWVSRRESEGREQVRLKTLEEFRPHFDEEGRFLLIEGEEISDRFGSKPVHINALNLGALIPPQGGTNVQDVIRRNLRAVRVQEEMTGRPLLAHVNHPNFHWAITAEDMAHVLEERYFEVYNGHPGVRHQGDQEHPSVERLWDIANTLRIAGLNAPPLYGLATDDAHAYHGKGGASPGRGWVMVEARELSAAALIEAMRRGAFYASSGVTLAGTAYDTEARVLSVEVEQQDRAVYTTEFIGTTRADYNAHGLDAAGRVLAKVTGASARYNLTGDELYVRAVVSSDQPHQNPSFKGQVQQAWVQPVGWERQLNPAPEPGSAKASRR